MLNDDQDHTDILMINEDKWWQMMINDDQDHIDILMINDDKWR